MFIVEPLPTGLIYTSLNKISTLVLKDLFEFF